MELRSDAHLPIQSHWAHRYHCVCDAWPVRRQPANGQYQFILLGEQRHTHIYIYIYIFVCLSWMPFNIFIKYASYKCTDYYHYQHQTKEYSIIAQHFISPLLSAASSSLCRNSWVRWKMKQQLQAISIYWKFLPKIVSIIISLTKLLLMFLTRV